MKGRAQKQRKRFPSCYFSLSELGWPNQFARPVQLDRGAPLAHAWLAVLTRAGSNTTLERKYSGAIPFTFTSNIDLVRIPIQLHCQNNLGVVEMMSACSKTLTSLGKLQRALVSLMRPPCGQEEAGPERTVNVLTSSQRNRRAHTLDGEFNLGRA
ncbi:hypothetical protein RRG08_025887 [Elysia crispata]|uniref:Uncharacterized protein n=1 Tax=Elysia crispata TaxID=231223 RepID=A0AAE1DJS4_9GAST|nr:hypothetical protein RRG08_025887 [Elysia crispata]